MPTDNALLPPTIHLSYLADDAIVAYLRRARESIRFVGPGLSSAVAKELKERWYISSSVWAMVSVCAGGFAPVFVSRWDLTELFHPSPLTHLLCQRGRLP